MRYVGPASFANARAFGVSSAHPSQSARSAFMSYSQSLAVNGPTVESCTSSTSTPLPDWSICCTVVSADSLGGETSSTVTPGRSEEHTSELQSLMRRSYAVFCLKKKNTHA